MREYGLLVLRLALAAVFIGHGAQKLFGIWGGGGLTAMAGIFQNLGLVPAFPLAVLVGAVEFFGGLLLAAGALSLDRFRAASAERSGRPRTSQSSFRRFSWIDVTS
jgi:uncharacterized membrane protein YphA (DoxX/SURF4 family)